MAKTRKSFRYVDVVVIPIIVLACSQEMNKDIGNYMEYEKEIGMPKQLKGKEISLSSIGLREVAWKYDDSLAFIEHCEKNEIFILGGDVLEKQGNEYRHNYDNWCFEKNQGNYKDSVKRASEYIKNYPKGEYAFVIIID